MSEIVSISIGIGVIIGVTVSVTCYALFKRVFG